LKKIVFHIVTFLIIIFKRKNLCSIPKHSWYMEWTMEKVARKKYKRKRKVRK
jgi:hypothetical protein